MSPLDAIAFADLLDKCRDEPDPSGTALGYAPNGTFTKQERSGRLYWYYRGYEKSAGGTRGTSTLEYVGPVGDPKADAVAASHAVRNGLYRKRHELASHLRRAGLPSPSPLEGRIVEALSKAGLLRGETVVVGTMAYQTYGGLLGVRMSEGSYRTEDVDLARPLGLQLSARGTSTDPMVELRSADPTFEPLFHADVPGKALGYRNASGFKVEFLSPMRAARKRPPPGGGPFADLPGIEPQQLTALEFLLRQPVDSVLLHDAGLIMRVPDPARFAVHKLMVAVLRTRGSRPGGGGAKVTKDVKQAETLIRAHAIADRHYDLGRAWLEAFTSGPSWRRTLGEGTTRLDDATLEQLADCVTRVATMDGLDDPFDRDGDARRSLAAAVSGSAPTGVSPLGGRPSKSKSKSKRDAGPEEVER